MKYLREAYFASVSGLLLTAIIIMACMYSCSTLNKKAGLEDDNIIEESVEAAIKYKTGFDLDLTPETP